MSTRSGSLALHRIDANGVPSLLTAFNFGEDSQHSAMLLTSIDDVLKSQDLKLSGVSRLVTSSGPGSFTGLRIALASLKALAYAKQIPLELVSSSESRARAFQNRNASVSGSLSIVTRVATGSYCIAKLSGSEFIEESEQLDGAFVLVDSPVTQEFAATSQPEKEIALFPSQAEYLGETLLHCTTRRTYTSMEELVAANPNYFGSSRF